MSPHTQREEISKQEIWLVPLSPTCSFTHLVAAATLSVLVTSRICRLQPVRCLVHQLFSPCSVRHAARTLKPLRSSCLYEFPRAGVTARDEDEHPGGGSPSASPVPAQESSTGPRGPARYSHMAFYGTGTHAWGEIESS